MKEEINNYIKKSTLINREHTKKILQQLITELKKSSIYIVIDPIDKGEHTKNH